MPNPSAHGAPGQPVAAPLPPALAELAEDFLAVGERDRLQMLHDLSWDLPDLPGWLREDYGQLEQVSECQSPIFLLVQVDPATGVHVHVDAPATAPTSRGFAEVLRAGLEGLSPAEALAVPDDVPGLLGLRAVVSPLRLSGMAGLVARAKRQIRQGGRG